LLFSAIDGPLIFAFYARRDTRTPTLVGLASTGVYLLLVGAGMALSASGAREFSLADLVLCDSLKTGFDALLMGLLLSRRIGGLGGWSLVPLAAKVGLASAAMGGVVFLVMEALQAQVGSATFGALAVVALGSSLAGALVYAGLAGLLKVRELHGLLPRRLRPKDSEA